MDWQRVSVAATFGVAAMADLETWARVSLGVAAILVLVWPLLPNAGLREFFFGHMDDPQQVAVVGAGNSLPFPNMPICELFSHIDPHVLDRDVHGSPWENVGQSIRDAHALKKIDLWGRKLPSNREKYEPSSGAVPPITEIPRDYWDEADFTYNFFDATRDYGHADCVTKKDSKFSNYFDVKSNLHQANLEWSKPLKPDPQISYRAVSKQSVASGTVVGVIFVNWNLETQTAKAVSETVGIVATAATEESLSFSNQPLVIDCLFENAEGPFAWSIESTTDKHFSLISYQEIMNTRKRIIIRVSDQFCALTTRTLTITFRTKS